MKSPEGDMQDVVIVGAGAAGLAAARHLARARCRVALLEARSRIGGRIWSERVRGWPAPVELGAEFVHGGNPPLEALLRAGRLQKAPVTEQHWQITGGRRINRPDTWERIMEVMRRIGPRFRGSFADWLREHGDQISREDRELAQSFVEGFQGAPLERMSAHALFEGSKEEDDQMRLRGGYAQLVDHLERELKHRAVRVLTGHVVEEIRWKRGATVVRTTRGTEFAARTCLLTIPQGVWKRREGEGRIRFSPALPAKDRALGRLESGHAVRLILRMRTDIWRRGVIPEELREKSGRSFGFLHSNERPFPVWWSLAPSPMIVGWTGGPAAGAMDTLGDPEIFAAGVDTLAKLLGCSRRSLRRSIVDWRTHNWAADPFTRGAYSYATAGAERETLELAKPVSGTLFFAGEALTDPVEVGTVHGAIASGERAAREILGTLKAQR